MSPAEMTAEIEGLLAAEIEGLRERLEEGHEKYPYPVNWTLGIYWARFMPMEQDRYLPPLAQRAIRMFMDMHDQLYEGSPKNGEWKAFDPGAGGGVSLSVVQAAARAIGQRRPALPIVAAAAERLDGPLLNMRGAARRVGVRREVVMAACRGGLLTYVWRGRGRLVAAAEVDAWALRYRSENPRGGQAYRRQALARAAEARRMAAAGVARGSLALRLGVSRRTVRRYLAVATP